MQVLITTTFGYIAATVIFITIVILFRSILGGPKSDAPKNDDENTPNN